MSVDVMSWVWKNSKQKGTALLVLLAIADSCNPDGECYPGTKHLADKARISIPTLHSVLYILEQDKEVGIENGEGKAANGGVTNRYFVNGYRQSLDKPLPPVYSNTHGEYAQKKSRKQTRFVRDTDTPVNPTLQGINPILDGVNTPQPPPVNPALQNPSLEPLKLNALVVESLDSNKSVDKSTTLTLSPDGGSENATDPMASSQEQKLPVADEQPASLPPSKPESAVPGQQSASPPNSAPTPSPRRIDPAACPGETLVAAFGDVSGHWDKKTGWDDARFVYVGRADRWRGLKKSPWSNPVKLPENAPPELRKEIIEKYRQHLWGLLEGNYDNIQKLLALDGKILVCWCQTDTRLKADAKHCECHAEKLRNAITYFKAHPEKIPPKPVDQWYDHEALKAEVCRIFALPPEASQAGYVLAMLRGKATKAWKDGNLPPDKVMNAEMLSRWEQWYRATYPTQRMVSTAVNIQAYILRWWAAGCPVPDAPSRDAALPGSYHPNRPLSDADYQIPDFDYTEVSHAG